MCERKVLLLFIYTLREDQSNIKPFFLKDNVYNQNLIYFSAGIIVGVVAIVAVTIVVFLILFVRHGNLCKERDNGMFISKTMWFIYNGICNIYLLVSQLKK